LSVFVITRAAPITGSSTGFDTTAGAGAGGGGAGAGGVLAHAASKIAAVRMHFFTAFDRLPGR
jgi:hypothetical protein